MPVAAPPPVNKWLVALSVSFGTLMGTIDGSIVNVALPHLRGATGASVEQITWVVSSFVIATVLVMPLTAFLGSFFGQKRVYLASLVLFLAGSVLCGAARTLPELAFFRALQGLGAGALLPTEQAILRQTFPPREQGMAMAVFSTVVVTGPAIGPTLGGWLVDHYGWQWIFFVNLPVGGVGLFLVSRFVHEPEDLREAARRRAEAQRRDLDWQGIALMCLGLAALQFFLEEGGRREWLDSPVIVAAALVAAFALAAFAVRELTAPVPAVDLRLFADPVFASGTVLGAVMFAMLFGNLFLLPLLMQDLLGFTALESGIALMPRVLVMVVATPLVGKLYNRVSPRLMIGLGVVAFALGSWLMSRFTLQTTQRDVIEAILLQGLGFSLLFVPLTTLSLSTVERTRISDATGLLSLFRQVGGSLGLAIFATFLTRGAAQARAGLVPPLSPTRPEIQAQLASPDGLAGLERLVSRQSQLLAYDEIFLASGLFFLAALPLLLFLKAPRARPGLAPER